MVVATVESIVGADEEAEESHTAMRATQHRGCQPQWIVLLPTERNYCFSHVVPYYRSESVTTGGNLRLGDRPKESGKEEAVRCPLG